MSEQTVHGLVLVFPLLITIVVITIASFRLKEALWSAFGLTVIFFSLTVYYLVQSTSASLQVVEIRQWLEHVGSARDYAFSIGQMGASIGLYGSLLVCLLILFVNKLGLKTNARQVALLALFQSFFFISVSAANISTFFISTGVAFFSLGFAALTFNRQAKPPELIWPIALVFWLVAHGTLLSSTWPSVGDPFTGLGYFAYYLSKIAAVLLLVSPLLERSSAIEEHLLYRIFRDSVLPLIGWSYLQRFTTPVFFVEEVALLAGLFLLLGLSALAGSLPETTVRRVVAGQYVLAAIALFGGHISASLALMFFPAAGIFLWSVLTNFHKRNYLWDTSETLLDSAKKHPWFFSFYAVASLSLLQIAPFGGFLSLARLLDLSLLHENTVGVFWMCFIGQGLFTFSFAKAVVSDRPIGKPETPQSFSSEWPFLVLSLLVVFAPLTLFLLDDDFLITTTLSGGNVLLVHLAFFFWLLLCLAVGAYFKSSPAFAGHLERVTLWRRSLFRKSELGVPLWQSIGTIPGTVFGKLERLASIKFSSGLVKSALELGRMEKALRFRPALAVALSISLLAVVLLVLVFRGGSLDAF